MFPIYSLQDMIILKKTQFNNWKSKVIDITYDISEENLKTALNRICEEANEAALAQHQFIVLSDRAVNSDRVPVSAALACGAVHHHLIGTRVRSKCGILIGKVAPKISVITIFANIVTKFDFFFH